MKAQIQLPPKLIPVFTGESRYRGAWGGRGSGKTRGFALMTAVKAYQFAKQGISGVILCGREFMNSLADSSFEEVKQAIKSVSWLHDYFDIGENYIRTKNKLVSYSFTGLRHNLDSLKSKARILIAWVDEAENVSEMAWRKLTPTVREDKSEIWVTWNPEKRNSATDKRFRKRSHDKIVRLNYSDNPWFPDVLEQERLSDKEHLPEAVYDWIWEGDYLDDSDLSKIKRKWVMSAVNAHTKLNFEPSGIKVVGYDVADSGDDKNATANRHGSVLYKVAEWQADEDELLESCQRVYANADSTDSEIIYDCIGVGAGAGAEFKRLNDSQAYSGRADIRYHKFNAGGGVHEPDRAYKQGDTTTQVTNKDKYANIKAQAWDSLATRLKNTYNLLNKPEQYQGKFDTDELISISTEYIDDDMLEQIADELSAPMEQFNSNTQCKIESKKDMRKRGIPSPNVADSIVMAFAYHLVAKRKNYRATAGKRTF